MFGGYCECFCWSNQDFYDDDFYLPDPQPFSLPAPLPKWPQGINTSIHKLLSFLVLFFLKMSYLFDYVSLGRDINSSFLFFWLINYGFGC
jgi:hypothetical protein